MNEAEEALRFLADDEFTAGIKLAIELSGVCVLTRKFAFIGCPLVEAMDALPSSIRDKGDEKSVVVLSFFGDLRYGTEAIFPLLRSHDFTHVIWQRGFRSAESKWKRVSLKCFEDTVKKL